jgi:hypothetical protein
MTEKPAPNPLEHLALADRLLAAQQRFLPDNAAYARMAEAMRDIAQANARYMQEVMQANAALFAACMSRGDEPEERPSNAAHRPH